MKNWYIIPATLGLIIFTQKDNNKLLDHHKIVNEIAKSLAVETGGLERLKRIDPSRSQIE